MLGAHTSDYFKYWNSRSLVSRRSVGHLQGSKWYCKWGDLGSEFVGPVIHADRGLPHPLAMDALGPPVAIAWRENQSSVDMEEVRMYASRLDVLQEEACSREGW
jgi:hypothetical protein